MGMNTSVHFSSKTPEWSTPVAFFNELDAEFDFNLDPCATKENAKCKRFFTEQDDGLAQDWSGARVFCNPPYGRVIGKWVEKCAGGGAMSLSRYFPLEPIRNGSTNISTERRKYVSSKDASSLAGIQTRHRSRAWSSFGGVWITRFEFTVDTV